MNTKKLRNKVIRVAQIPVNIMPKFLLNSLWNAMSTSESLIAILYRYLYLKKYAKNLGDNVFIGKYVTLKNIKNLSLGNNVSIHAYNYIDAYGDIIIENNVSIANHCTIISSDHTWEDRNIPIKYNKVIKKSILIKEDVWIAAGVRVLGDSVIAKRNVIGAGAVVNKSTKENGLYVGVPIKKIKEI
ncbi:acyltransferase [Mammaliicoccus sciuri]|uniref:acyltransferase n=1 Tax=Mammaliicoccus sciuri TaxID=1296 RepID=UPI00208ED973|nr:acyltransferase [Mammaliicoccus sciuri]MCO4323965.1 acyltransferase [Mammaliicoccus sciuri]